MAYDSRHLEISRGRWVHYIESTKYGPGTPLVAIHGLGGSCSFWLPMLQASDIAKDRRVLAYDFDGHGLSPFSGKTELDITDLAQDLIDFLEKLKLETVILLGHSINGSVLSFFAGLVPWQVEKLILLHPVRNLSLAARDSMQKRGALASSGLAGMSEIANIVSKSAVSKRTAISSPTAVAFIRHLVLSTNPAAYAAACHALTTAPKTDVKEFPCKLYIIGGEEDTLATRKSVEQWANEVPKGRGRAVVLKDVGHWGPIEAPERIGDALKTFLAA